MKVYRKKGIYIFVAKIVEKDPKQENMPEIIEAIKFIRRWIIVDSSSFPKLLANSLVSLAECNDEQIKKASIETIRKLALRNAELASDCEGIRVLFKAVLDPNNEDSCESITYSLLLLLNNTKTRTKLGVHMNF